MLQGIARCMQGPPGKYVRDKQLGIFNRQTCVYLEEFDSAPEENTFQMYFALGSMMHLGIHGFNCLKYVVWYGFNKSE